MPGYTHLQIAQPISLAHHCLAYVEMMGRDRSRLKDCIERLNENPLGSGALAGTSFPIDRNLTSKLLKFSKPTANALDSVSDRDFVIDFLYSASTCAMHLSRIAEEIVLWSSNLVNFCEIKDDMMSSSSIMPQKKNPDAAELVRAKTSLINGNLSSMLGIMKSLPLSYSKDLQEDKEALFDAVETANDCIQIATGVLSTLEPQVENMKKILGAL